MADDSTKPDLVNILVVSSDEDGTRDRENLWASPVAAYDAGGLFEIHSVGLFAPLAPGDIVRCELNGDSRYQVVEIVDPQPVGVAFAKTASPDLDEDLLRLMESHGGMAVVHAPGIIGIVATNPGLFAACDAFVESGELIEFVCMRNPQIPTDQWGLVLELEESSASPSTGTNYWVGHDPFWSANDLDSPDFLARIQMLASVDDRVARALETGRQDQVVRFVQRADAIERGDLVEPLTGPIFTED